MILHAIPDFAMRWPDSGDWKAAKAFGFALEAAGGPVRTHVFPPEDVRALVDACAPEIAAVFVEYSFWPDALKALAAARPGVRRYVRTINAEALQHWHRERAVSRAWRLLPRTFYGAARLLRRDSLCRIRAHALLGINSWENRAYWGRLPGRARVLYLPYFCPWPRLRPEGRQAPWTARDRVVAVLPGCLSLPFHRDQVAGLSSFAVRAGRLPGRGDAWRYVSTRGVWNEAPPVPPPPELEFLPPVADIWELMGTVRAVAVLSDLGMGLKTTVVDALAAGCHVLVKPGLHRRMPPEIAAHCIACDPVSDSSVAAALERLERSPTADVNAQLERMAVDGLRELMRDGQSDASE